MRLYLVFALSLIYACAPVVCPESDQIKVQYAQSEVPSRYEANLSLRYGLVRFPIRLKKVEDSFYLAGNGRTAEMTSNTLCFGNTCIEMPVTPDGIIFGRVLKGGEKMTCSREGLSFEREDERFFSRFIFKQGRLVTAEFHDRSKERKLVLNYLEWSQEGHAKALSIKTEGMSALLTVDGLKF